MPLSVVSIGKSEPFWQPKEVGGHLNEDRFGGDLKGHPAQAPYLQLDVE